MNLIKFSSTNYLISNLKNSTLYFNSIKRLNDPHEGVFRYHLPSDPAAIRNFYVKHFNDLSKVEHYVNNKSELEAKLNKTFEWRHANNGICCFSDESCLTNTLMWSKYADGHKGICYIFDDQVTFYASSEVHRSDRIVAAPTGPHKIKYVSDYIDQDITAKKLNQMNFLTTKFSLWSDEKEYRYISPVAGAYNFSANSLKEIVFGLNCRSEFIENVKVLVKEKYDGVLLKKVSKMFNTFSLAIEAVK